MTTQKKQRIEPRKMLLFLPVLIIPIMAWVFQSLGGGSGEIEHAHQQKGLNTDLPDAQFGKQQPADKMAYYEQASQDSARNENTGLELTAEKLGFERKESAQAEQVNEKLAAINRELAAPYVAPKPSPSGAYRSPSVQQPISTDVDRLESLMKSMKENDAGGDPEMAQLNSMMDKILQIQNPELLRQQLKKEVPTTPDSLFRTIPAVIASNQKATQGSVVELRLLDTVVLNSQVIPKGHALFGLVSFGNQRMILEIKNIRLGTSVIPVNLTVYDKRDAMIGVYAPEALLSDAVNGGVTDAAGSIGITGFDLTTQIAGAGIDAARSLLTKKIKRIKQPLKAGYPLLLRDNSLKINR